MADPQQWKVLILDGGSRKLIDGVVGEDDILALNVTSQSTISDVDGRIRAEVVQTSSRSKSEDR